MDEPDSNLHPKISRTLLAQIIGANTRSHSQLPEKVPGVCRDRPDHQVPVQEVVDALTVGFAKVHVAVASDLEVPLVVLVQAADWIV